MNVASGLSSKKTKRKARSQASLIQAAHASVEHLEHRVLLTAVIVNPTPAQVGIYSTGVDSSHMLLPAGAKDPNYSLVSSPVGVASAYEVTSPAAEGWDADTATSQWISYTTDPNAVGQTGAYDYRTQFDLSNFAPSTLRIKGSLEVDNPGVQVQLNGNNIYNPGFAFGTYFEQELFQTEGGGRLGSNNLDFVVGGQGNTTGLQVAMTATAYPAQASGVVSLTGTEGQDSGLVTLATFGDTDYLKPLDSYTATINWGDGSASDNTSAVFVDNHNGTYSVEGDHTWLEEGNPNIVTIVIHNAGGTDDGPSNTPDADVTATDAAVVIDPPIVATPAGAINAVAWQDSQVTVATFTDPGGPEDPTMDYAAQVNWGDGTALDSTTPTIIQIGNTNTFKVVADHTYDVGTTGTPLPVVVTIDHEATTPQTVTDTITVAPPALKSVTLPSFTEGLDSGTINLATFSGGPLGPTSEFAATITWGDGSMSTGTVVADSANPSTYDVQGNHAYAEEGNDVVTIEVDQTLPSPSSTQVMAFGTDTATVVDAPLTSGVTVAIGAQEGSLFSGQVATFTDTYTLDPAGASDFSAIVTWGDGTHSTGTVAATATPGVYAVTASHTYIEDGSYKAVVAVADVGGSKINITDTATITEAPITATAGPTIFATTGVAFSGKVLATFQDADTLEPLGEYSATISWGDGSLTSGTVSGSAGSYTVTAGHTYTHSGGYGAVVTIDDGGTPAATATTTVTVTNPIVPAKLYINDVTVTAGTSSVNAVFTVTRTGDLTHASSVHFATANGSATAPANYVAGSGTVNFGIGQSTATVTVKVNGQTTHQTTKQFDVNLSSAVGASIGDGQGIGTIVSGIVVAPSFSINNVSGTAPTSGLKNFVFTVTRSGSTTGTSTVHFATANGTAIAGTDYNSASGTLTFAPGVTSKTITVQIKAQSVYELSKYFKVNLSGATNATITTASGTGTITTPYSLPKLSTSGATASEGTSGQKAFTFAVTLDVGSSQTITVKYATSNGSATSPTNYVATSGTLTFTPGQTIKYVTVFVKGGTSTQAEEDFFLKLSTPVNATIAVGTGTGTILK